MQFLIHMKILHRELLKIPQTVDLSRALIRRKTYLPPFQPPKEKPATVALRLLHQKNEKLKVGNKK